MVFLELNVPRSQSSLRHCNGSVYQRSKDQLSIGSSGKFVRILFSRILLKEIFVTLKFVTCA